MPVYKIYCCLLFFCLCSFNLYSQKNEAVISGFVTDAITGEALYGTNILLYKDTLNLQEKPFAGTTSNSYGFYAVPKMPGGTYFLVARYIGYKPLIREIEVASVSIQFNFQMIPESIKLEEVYVTGEKRTTTEISTINISPELLTKIPSLSGESALFKALQMLPGVSAASELSSGLYVRGGSPDQNLTLVDGVIFYNPTHLGNFTSSFNSDAVQNVKLIKGAFPAEYGGRLSSVLDIKLRAGTKEKDKGLIGLGTLSSRFLLEGPLSSKATYMISGRKMYYDLLQNSFFKNSITPRYNFYDVNAKIAYNISASDILWLGGSLSRDKIVNPSASKEFDYNINWDNTSLSLNWLRINSKSVFLNTSISYVDYRFRSILNDRTANAVSPNYFSSSILRDVFVKTGAEIHINQSQMLDIGAELAVHNYNLIYTDHYNEALERSLNSDQGIIAGEAAFYIEDQWQISAHFKTNLGGRFYYFKSKKYFRFEPRLSATYSFNEDLHLNAAFAEAHQFLHLILRNDISLPTDLWYPSTEHVAPSKATQYVIGLDSYFQNKEYQFSVEGYYKKMINLNEFKNAPQLNPGIPLHDFLTAGQGEAYGAEVFLNKRAGAFTGWIGYTLSWTKRKFDELNGGKIFYPRYDRRHDVSVIIAYSLTEDFNLGASWIYATGQGFTVPVGQYQFQNVGLNEPVLTQVEYTGRNEYRLPSYHKLDLSATYKFQWLQLPFEVFLNIFNVYNRQNPFSYYISEKDGKTVLRQISLFPFIPTAGINVKF